MTPGERSRRRGPRLAALLAVVAALLVAGSAWAWDGAASSTDWSGAGTASDPYVIADAAQLRGLADSVNAGTSYAGSSFALGADIDLGNAAWTPIGGACPLGADGVPTGHAFSGTFDGGNHTISGLNVSGPEAGTGAYGFFGYIDGATIANVTVAGVLDMGTSSVDGIGGVVGYARGSSLFNVHNAVTVTMHDAALTASMCGGVAGAVDNPSATSPVYVRYCFNTTGVTGRGRVGGIVGAVYCVGDGGVVVDQCFNTGDVTSTTSGTKIFTGGIAGYCRGSISACYNQGRMTTNGGHYLAGVVGMLQGADPVASLSSCYSTATFTSYNPSYDRFLWASADSSPAVHITDCFWLPAMANADMSQPYDATGSWGSQTRVSAVTAAQLVGDEPLTGSNDTGTFDGEVLSYLGAADPDDAHGSYGFDYASGGGYPVLVWQLLDDFRVDPASGVPAPLTTFTVSVAVTGGHGTATASPSTVEAGGTSTITLAPAAGYWLDTLTDNGADVLGQVVSGVYTLADVATSHTVVAAFTDGTRTLTYTAGAHGTIAGPAVQQVAQGTAGSAVTAVPLAGYHFAAWTDGSTANPRTDTAAGTDLAARAIFLPDDDATARPWDHFTIAVLPDTQYYAQSYPEIFEAQTQWIADHAKTENIVFVSHLGDLVDTYNSASQWRNARDSMAIVRAAGIPFSIAAGNHDLGYLTHDVSYFDAAFPFASFSGAPWYGGHYPATSNANSYQLFSAMGQRFIVLNLVPDATLLADGAADWANAVLDEYADRKAIVVAHGYVDTSGAFVAGDAVDGARVWEDVVKRHANVVAVLCGHYSGEYAGVSTGAGGATIRNLLTDYQSEPAGGNGWLRLYEFSPLDDSVRAVTYSPYLDAYQTDADSAFAFPLAQDSHLVTFESEAATFARVVAASGSQITAPASPVRTGWVFEGWSTDVAGADVVSFPYTVAADTTLHAVWARERSIVLSRPRAGAVWRRGSAQTVRWTTGGSFDDVRFTVTLLDAAGHSRATARVGAASGTTTYTAALRLGDAVTSGAYTVRVSGGGVDAESPSIRVVPATALRVTAPTGPARWRRGSTRTVSWSLLKSLTGGAFDLELRGPAGRKYTLLNSYVPAGWSGRYSRRVRLPAGVPARTGYRLIVRWREGTSTLTALGPPVTVTR